MNSLDTVVAVLRENVPNVVDRSELEYRVLAKLVIEAVERGYEERYLVALRDSQASAFEEDINERKARQ